MTTRASLSTTRSGRDRRREILDIAGEVFLAHGYEAASMGEIAAQVGGSKATLYSYFRSKEELFESFIRDECERRIAGVFDLPKETGEPEEVLRALGRKFVDLILDKRVVAIQRVVIGDSGRFPEIGRIFYEAGPNEAEHILASYISRAVQDGKLVASNPALAAEQFVSLCRTSLHLKHLVGLVSDPKRKEKDDVVEGALAVFMAAYGVKKP